jgi:arylsulfatase
LGGCAPAPVQRGACKDCNVVLLLVDALRFDHLGCYGYPKGTSPNIDKVCQEGLVFENAISQAASTRMAVTSLFASHYLIKYPSSPDNYALPDSALTLAEVLSANGYRTQAVYDNPKIDKGSGLSQGFNGYDLVNGDAEKAAYSFNWIDKHIDQKFFLYVHFMAPHADYVPPEGYKERFKLNYGGGIDFKGKHQDFFNQRALSQEDIEELRARYDGEIVSVDAEIGRFVAHLKERGLLEKTILIIMADHGEALAENKVVGHAWPLNVVAQVPLIVRLPQGHSQQRVSKVVESIDIAPSILDKLGLDVPRVFQGRKVFDAGAIQDKISFTLTRFAWVLARSERYSFKTDGAQMFLYDLKTDPYELVDIGQKDPQQVKGFSAAYRGFMARGDKQPLEYRPIDGDTAMKLKALGYLQ